MAQEHTAWPDHFKREDRPPGLTGNNALEVFIGSLIYERNTVQNGSRADFCSARQ
jgi:hypothetical protein